MKQLGVIRSSGSEVFQAERDRDGKADTQSQQNVKKSSS